MDARRAYRYLVAAVVAVGANKACVNVSPTCNRCPEPVGYVCAICNTTPAALHAGVTWVAGGGAHGTPQCSDNTGETKPTQWIVLDNTVVQGGSALPLNGGFTLAGKNISIANTVTTKAITLQGQNTSGCTIKDVRVTNDVVAVRVIRSSATGPLATVDGLHIENAVNARDQNAVAIAHISNDNVHITCAKQSNAVTLQPLTELTKLDIGPSCVVTDLSAILNEFGRAYETHFFDPQARPTDPVLAQALRWVILMDVILIAMMSLCYTAPTPNALKPKSD